MKAEVKQGLLRTELLNQWTSGGGSGKRRVSLVDIRNSSLRRRFSALPYEWPSERLSSRTLHS